MKTRRSAPEGASAATATATTGNITTGGPLSTAETQRLHECERLIERGITKIGEAMDELEVDTFPVGDITIGDRIRTDLGDIDRLAESIRTVGLIHPILVDQHRVLIDGQRRMLAWAQAKPGEPIPARTLHVATETDRLEMIGAAQMWEDLRLSERLSAAMSLETTGAAEIDRLAALANLHHEHAAVAARTTLDHALGAGDALTAAKALIDHGRWLPWIRENFVGSERMARNYMRLAANRERVADLGEVPIRDAIEALATPRTAETRPKAELTLDDRARRAVGQLSSALMDLAGIAAEVDGDSQSLGAHTGMALVLYQQINERRIDVELRELLAAEGGGSAT